MSGKRNFFFSHHHIGYEYLKTVLKFAKWNSNIACGEVCLNPPPPQPMPLSLQPRHSFNPLNDGVGIWWKNKELIRTGTGLAGKELKSYGLSVNQS
jgi:hypothetical protein